MSIKTPVGRAVGRSGGLAGGRNRRLARAKVNLALHVTGRRADGYHLLDSLVVFAETGDFLSVAPDPAGGIGLRITGPMAAGLSDAGGDTGGDNLVLRAARLLALGRADLPGVRLTLEKHLPVASGIGGGSADAAAALHLLAGHWALTLPDTAAVLSLGADVPVCLEGRAARMTGIGESVSPLDKPLPPVWMVLVNPGQGVSTPAVFRALDRRDNPPMPAPAAWADARALADWLHGCRNDLQDPAQQVCPVIGQVLAALAGQDQCLIARMSGSGATCFGLFADPGAAEAAAARIRSATPGWWVAAARMAG